MPDPQQKVTLRRRGTNETKVVITPPGIRVAINDVIDVLGRGWPAYAGQAVVNCSTTPIVAPPVTGAPPTLNPAFVLPGAIVGVPYIAYIPLSVVIAATGKTATTIVASGLPAWLTATTVPGDPIPYRISGTPPVGTTTALITLTGTQNDAQTVVAQRTISAITQIITPHVRYEPGIGFRIRIGGDNGATLPRIKVISAPAGWTNFAQDTMYPFVTTSEGTPMFYAKTDYPVGPNGAYVFQFLHYGQTVYSTFVNTGLLKEELTPITTAPPASQVPVLVVAAGVDEGGSVTAIISDQITGAALSGWAFALTSPPVGVTLATAGSSATVSVAANAVVGDGVNITITATKAGFTALSAVIAVADKTPATVVPTFNPAFTLPDAQPGGSYYAPLPLSVGVPAAGQTIVIVRATGLPSWLTYVSAPGQDPPFKLIGNTVPANIGVTTITLEVAHVSGGSATKQYTIGVGAVAAEIYPYIRYEPGIAFRIFLGGDNGSGNLPYVKLVKAPSGYTDLGRYVMPAEGRAALGRFFFYAYNSFPVGPAGEYVFQFEHYGRTVYATFNNTGAYQEVIAPVTATPPAGTQTIGLIAPATVAEGGNVSAAVIDQSSGNELVGYTFSLSNARPGASIAPNGNLATITVVANPFAGDGYEMSIVATKGSSVLSSILRVVDTSPAYTTVGLWDGVSNNSIQAIDYDWRFNNPGSGQASDANFFIKVDTSLANLKMAIKPFGGTKSAYTNLNSFGPDANGYNRILNLYNATANQSVMLYFSTNNGVSDFFSTATPSFPSSGSVARTNIWAGGGSGGAPPLRLQQLSLNGATSYVTVVGTDCNSQHPPTPAELLTLQATRPSEYVWTAVNCGPVTGQLGAGMVARTFSGINVSTVRGSDSEISALVYSIQNGRLMVTETSPYQAQGGGSMWYQIDEVFTQTLNAGGYLLGVPHVFRRFQVPPGRVIAGVAAGGNFWDQGNGQRNFVQIVTFQ